MKDFHAFAAIVCSSRPETRDVSRTADDDALSDLAWLLAGAPIAFLLGWLIVVAQH